MSRRYGRNQKRKAREEIARLKLAHGMNDGLLKHIGAKLEEARATISEMVSIVESVCANSIALPPKSVSVNARRDQYRLGQMETNFSGGHGQDCSPSPCSFTTSDLYALRLFLESNREAFRAAVHLEYSAGPHSAYMISESALWSIPQETLLKRIVPEIGRELIDHMRRDRR